MKDVADDAEMIFFFDDNKRMAVEEWGLYELDRVDEKGRHVYKLIGFTNVSEEAQKYLDMQPCKYVSATADDTTSVTDDEE